MFIKHLQDSRTLKHRIRCFFTKKILKFLSIKSVNYFVKLFFIPFVNHFPKALANIPVVGIFKVELPESKRLWVDALWGNVESKLYWGGFKGFEYDTVKLFIRLSKTSHVIFDGGSSLYNPNATICSFEPVPKVFESLKKKSNLNNLKNAVAEPYAVTNQNDKIDLFVPDSPFPTAASVTPKRNSYYKYNHSVPTTTIDLFCENNDIEKVDIIKIDVEGAEHIVLEGAPKTIKKHEPIIIAEILFDRQVERKARKKLENRNYACYLITDKGLVRKNKIVGDNTSKYLNYRFVPDKKISTLREDIPKNKIYLTGGSV